MSRANAAMARRMIGAGSPAAGVRLAGPDSAHQNLMATLHGRDTGAKPIPVMEHGATDGLVLRNLGVAVYGVSGPLYDVADRAHGRDERVSVRHFNQARAFWYHLVNRLTGIAPGA